jgi:hypothetical protein
MRLIGLAVVVALSLPFAPLATGAQQPRSADSRPFKPEELEQIVTPIVQYPDPLLAQIFMASTYPLEVIQAARFAKANPNLKDAALNEELKKQNWDDSVKALVSFPQVLELMDSPARVDAEARRCLPRAAKGHDGRHPACAVESAATARVILVLLSQC